MKEQEAIERLKNIIKESEKDENYACHVNGEDRKAMEIGIQSIRTLRAIEISYRKERKQKIEW